MTQATRIVTVANSSYMVVVFMNPDGTADAVVSESSGREVTRIKIDAAPKGRRIAVRRDFGGQCEVTYEDVS